jgi:hypothetical protein
MPLPKGPQKVIKVPTLDHTKIMGDIRNVHGNALFNQNRVPDNIDDTYEVWKKATDDVYEQARNNAPDAPAAKGGFPGIAHFPIKFVDSDGKKTTATLGRGSLFNMLVDQWGPDRAMEMARESAARNWKKSDPHDIYPALHPWGPDHHFDRNIHIIREDGKPINNGAAAPGPDYIRYRKADEGNTGDMEIHETAHQSADYGGIWNDRAITSSIRDQSPLFWMSNLKDPSSKTAVTKSMRDILMDSADEYGMDWDPQSGDFGPVSPEEFFHLMTNGAGNYFLRPAEMRANTQVWKNLALQRNGFYTLADLPKTVSQGDFFRNALTQDIAPIPPREATPNFDNEKYNYLQVMQRAIRENMNSKGTGLHDSLIGRLPMVGGIAAALSQGGASNGPERN